MKIRDGAIFFILSSPVWYELFQSGLRISKTGKLQGDNLAFLREEQQDN